MLPVWLPCVFFFLSLDVKNGTPNSDLVRPSHLAKWAAPLAQIASGHSNLAYSFTTKLSTNCSSLFTRWQFVRAARDVENGTKKSDQVRPKSDQIRPESAKVSQSKLSVRWQFVRAARNVENDTTKSDLSPKVESGCNKEIPVRKKKKLLFSHWNVTSLL